MDHVDNVLALASQEIVAAKDIKIASLSDKVAPGTLEDCIEFYERTGCVGVSNFMSSTRLFGTLEVCQAFDAWHDFCHIKLRASFDLDGEIKVNDCQQAQLKNWYRNCRRPVTFRAFERAAEMLAMNNVGRLKHWLFHHRPPRDPRSFAQGYLAARGYPDQPPMCDLAVYDEQYPREARVIY